MKTFEEYGRELDDLSRKFSEHAQPLVDKVKEVHGGFKEAMKTADRRGFERAIKLAARQLRSLNVSGVAPNIESDAKAVEGIEYIPPAD